MDKWKNKENNPLINHKEREERKEEREEENQGGRKNTPRIFVVNPFAISPSSS